MVSQSLAADPAPLPREALELALAPFGSSRMLPREAYVDQSVFEWEQRHFFAGGWFCIGRVEDLSAAGDQIAVSIGRWSVLLIRGSDGKLRAFANACRHRGHELLPCGGPKVNRTLVVCPYHAWSYKLDGTLRKAPGFDNLDDFAGAEFGLPELPVEEWHGYVFVDGSGEAPPFARHVAGLDAIVAPYEPERLVTAGRHDYVVSANWKILNENYQECYHCPVIHPELCCVSPPASGDNYQSTGGAWLGGSMELRPGMTTMSLDGTGSGSRLRGLDEERRNIVLYMAVFPNLLVSLHPDYVMTHRLTPLGPDETRIECSWAFSPEDLESSRFDPSYAIDFWDITNRQDWAACESVQRGQSGPHHHPGPLSPAEDAVYQFVTMVARGYVGLPLAAEVKTAERL
jgi:Rieske 2Fe-2S family protein